MGCHPVAVEESLGEFFEADERRRGEGLRFGDWWQAEDAPGIYHDLCWATRTGEVYTLSYVEILHAGLRWYPLRPPTRTVAVLAVVPELHDLQAKLAGWKDHENTYASLEWVKEQLGHPRRAEFFDAALGEGQRRVCRGWYERRLHFEQPGVDLAAGPGGIALCRPEGASERPDVFFRWQDVDDIVAGPWRWPHHHHRFPPPAAAHCYLSIETADECHVLLVPGSGQNMLTNRVRTVCEPWLPAE
jgi:hypothetical protein